jgi:hypothetical protein
MISSGLRGRKPRCLQKLLCGGPRLARLGPYARPLAPAQADRASTRLGSCAAALLAGRCTEPGLTQNA